ncbi:hypothetical protein [Megalodesulfovibrio gigas]|uniref:hypothetical protein n=1 Tax=Megalodesulfovibrio gigas TaxID=879 RepID=UPI0003F985FE|nr:hypothetical protein [Megalodesulfovibrio gigas]
MGVRNEIIQAVAAFLGAMGKSSIKQVREELRLTEDQAKDAVHALVERGRVVKTGRGVYAWQASSGVSGSVAARVWHAMLINTPAWTLDDIARQAGTTINYVRRCLVYWRKAGLVEQYGQRSLPEGGRIKLFRTTAKAKDYPNPSVDTPWAPDALTVQAVELIRLLATGQAARIPKDCARAQALCEVIAQELRQMNTQHAAAQCGR